MKEFVLHIKSLVVYAFKLLIRMMNRELNNKSKTDSNTRKENDNVSR